MVNMLNNATLMGWVSQTIATMVNLASETDKAHRLTVSKTPSGGLQLTISEGWAQSANDADVTSWAARQEPTGVLCARIALQVANILASDLYKVSELNQDERDMVARGENIAAIKAIRLRGGLGLKDAKDLVDAYRAKLTA